MEADKQKFSNANRETVFTLASYICGFVITACEVHWLLLGGPLLAAALMPPFNHLSRLEQLKIQTTMIVFGLITGYFLAWDAVSALMWLNVIRFYGEFQLVNNYHHPTLCWSSFLIYHSSAYMAANIFAIVQHLISRYVFSLSYKEGTILNIPAFVVASAATMLRLLAFYTAKSNFTHQVSFKKKVGHTLVTNGVYSFFRHPSYTGFFYFSVATMLMIGNFVSAVAYALVLMFFFEERIEYEQHYLHWFFGVKYEEYCKHTHILIPKLPPAFKKIINRKDSE